MPETKAMTREQYLAAERVFRSELLALLNRHRNNLDGEAGVITALIGVLGSVCVTVLAMPGSPDERAHARRFVHEQLSQLQTYVALAHGDLDVIDALVEMLKSQIVALQAYRATATARPS